MNRTQIPLYERRICEGDTESRSGLEHRSKGETDRWCIGV